MTAATFPEQRLPRDPCGLPRSSTVTAEGGTRTPTGIAQTDFESVARFPQAPRRQGVPRTAARWLHRWLHFPGESRPRRPRPRPRRRRVAGPSRRAQGGRAGDDRRDRPRGPLTASPRRGGPTPRPGHRRTPHEATRGRAARSPSLPPSASAWPGAGPAPRRTPASPPGPAARSAGLPIAPRRAFPRRRRGRRGRPSRGVGRPFRHPRRQPPCVKLAARPARAPTAVPATACRENGRQGGRRLVQPPATGRRGVRRRGSSGAARPAKNRPAKRQILPFCPRGGERRPRPARIGPAGLGRVDGSLTQAGQFGTRGRAVFRERTPCRSAVTTSATGIGSGSSRGCRAARGGHGGVAADDRPFIDAVRSPAETGTAVAGLAVGRRRLQRRPAAPRPPARTGGRPADRRGLGRRGHGTAVRGRPRRAGRARRGGFGTPRFPENRVHAAAGSRKQGPMGQPAALEPAGGPAGRRATAPAGRGRSPACRPPRRSPTRRTTPTATARPSSGGAPWRRSRLGGDPPQGRVPKIEHDRLLCKERHAVECCFGKPRHSRRVAARYDKQAANVLGFVFLGFVRPATINVMLLENRQTASLQSTRPGVLACVPHSRYRVRSESRLPGAV